MIDGGIGTECRRYLNFILAANFLLNQKTKTTILLKYVNPNGLWGRGTRERGGDQGGGEGGTL